jgi:acyl-CoA hydrolase
MKKFTYRELTTILAALRHLQREMEESGMDNLIKQYPHFADVDPLSESDIDELCETMYSGLVCENKPCQNDVQLERYSELECFVKTIAKLDKSGDFEVLGTVMSNDDAVDTADRLISEARDMVPREVWGTQMPS